MLDEQTIQLLREQYELNRKAQEKRYAALNSKDKSFFDALSCVHAGNYYLCYEDLIKIDEMYGHDKFRAYGRFFNLGFLKGQRAEKKRQANKRKASTTTPPPARARKK